MVLVNRLRLGVVSGSRFITPHARSATWSLRALRALDRTAALSVSVRVMLSVRLFASRFTGLHLMLIQAAFDSWGM